MMNLTAEDIDALIAIGLGPYLLVVLVLFLITYFNNKKK